MTISQQIITVLICVLGTMLTCFLPFMVFSPKAPTPKYIQYIGKALPSAIFGMLIIYCLKDINIFTGTRGLPEMLAIGLTIILHLWRRQMLLSIAAGTISYMILIQTIFI